MSTPVRQHRSYEEARAALAEYAGRTGLVEQDEYMSAVTGLITDLLRMVARDTSWESIEVLGLPEDPVDLLRAAEKQFRHYQETARL
jgi:hypothetical protein